MNVAALSFVFAKFDALFIIASLNAFANFAEFDNETLHVVGKVYLSIYVPKFVAITPLKLPDHVLEIEVGFDDEPIDKPNGTGNDKFA
ncbi:hypothetical protein J6P59_07570 [bacterium]|nr:hypothetical protein [bacterium]